MHSTPLQHFQPQVAKALYYWQEFNVLVIVLHKSKHSFLPKKKEKKEEKLVPNRPVCCTLWLVCSCGAPLFTGVPGAVEGTWPCMKLWLDWPEENPGGRRLGIPWYKNFLISKCEKKEERRKKGKKNLQLDCNRKNTFEFVLSHYWFRHKVFCQYTKHTEGVLTVLICAIALSNKPLLLSSKCNSAPILSRKLNPQKRENFDFLEIRNSCKIVHCFLYCISSLIRPLTTSMYTNILYFYYIFLNFLKQELSP